MYGAEKVPYIFNHNASVYLHERRKMNYYFITTIFLHPGKSREEYDDYVDCVKPIVESYGGKYVVRSESIEYLSDSWQPDRLIIIRFPDRSSIDECFNSKEYKGIMSKRTDSVDSQAIIVPEYVSEGRMCN